MRNNSSDFKPIYIHWYEDDFQADLAVRRMTSRQRAFYRNLLMYAYFGDKRPYLTADDAELWLIADADTQQEWLDNKKPILAKFTERMTKDGPRLVNKRVLEEWQIIEDYLGQRKKAGLASAAARRRENGHSDPEIPALIVHPATTVERPSTGVEHPLATVEHPSTGCQQAASSLPTNEDEDRDVDGDRDGDKNGERDEGLGSCSGAPEPPSLSLTVPQKLNQQAVAFIMYIAIDTKPTAIFSKKSKAEIVSIFEKASLSREELTETLDAIDPTVRKMVESMDDFQLRNAGSLIAASLEGCLLTAKFRKEETDRKAAIHKQEMRVVQESIARQEQERRELLARDKAEKDRMRQHYPDDSFCACPECQPDFWKPDAADLCPF